MVRSWVTTFLLGGSAQKRNERRFKVAAAHLQQALAAEGISAEEILKEFKRWRRGERK